MAASVQAAQPLQLAGRSRISAQPAVTYHWSVEGLSAERIKRSKAAQLEKIRSPDFNAFGARWCLILYLAKEVHGEAHVALFLHILSGVPPPVHQSVTVGNVVARDHPLVNFSVSKPVPEGSVPGYGWGKLISHAELSKNPDSFIADGVLQVTLTLKDASLTAVSSSIEPTAPGGPVPAPSFLSEMRQLLAGTRGSPFDVKLLCSDGQLFLAHAFVLSLRSGVFAAQLSADGPLAPVDRERVPVPPEITAATLRRLLEFIYTDELSPASAEEAQHLLNAADHYALPRLLAICERTLEQQLSVDNAAFTLTLAAQHRARALERAAVFFAARNGAAVMRTEGWAHLSAARPLLKDKILHAALTGELLPEEEEEEGAAGGAAGGSSAGAGGSGGGEGGRVTRGGNKRPRVG